MSDLKEALAQGWIEPPADGSQQDQDGPRPAYRIDPSVLKDKVLSRQLRRADRFSRLATLAACDALSDSGVDRTSAEETGIILATSFGPHVTTFKFLDDILDYGDLEVSPTLFSHSVHNAAASYIAKILDIRGPTQTLTQFSFSFHQALILAQAWLDEKRCSHVLVGVAEECGTILEYLYHRMLDTADQGRIQPFTFSSTPAAVPGEGSVFFLVTDQTVPGTYGNVAVLNEEEIAMWTKDADLSILDSDGLARDEKCYLDSLSPDLPSASYAPLFGSMMTGSAFNCAVGALMIREQAFYASPSTDNPHGIRLFDPRETDKLERILCIKYDCTGQREAIALRRGSAGKEGA